MVQPPGPLFVDEVQDNISVRRREQPGFAEVRKLCEALKMVRDPFEHPVVLLNVDNRVPTDQHYSQGAWFG